MTAVNDSNGRVNAAQRWRIDFSSMSSTICNASIKLRKWRERERTRSRGLQQRQCVQGTVVLASSLRGVCVQRRDGVYGVQEHRRRHAALWEPDQGDAIFVVIVVLVRSWVGESEHISEHRGRFRQDDPVQPEIEFVHKSEDGVCICVVKWRTIIASFIPAHVQLPAAEEKLPIGALSNL